MKMVFVDYPTAWECRNEDAWFICYKCGECGRIFDGGYLVDEGGTHIDERFD